MPRDPATLVPPRESARPEHKTEQPKQQEQLYIYAILRRLEPANQLHLRTTIDKQALAYVIQALQKHTSPPI